MRYIDTACDAAARLRRQARRGEAPDPALVRRLGCAVGHALADPTLAPLSLMGLQAELDRLAETLGRARQATERELRALAEARGAIAAYARRP